MVSDDSARGCPGQIKMWSIACEAAGGKEHKTQKIRNRVCVGVGGSCLTIGTLCGTLASQPAFEAFAVGMHVRLDMFG